MLTLEIALALIFQLVIFSAICQSTVKFLKFNLVRFSYFQVFKCWELSTFQCWTLYYKIGRYYTLKWKLKNWNIGNWRKVEMIESNIENNILGYWILKAVNLKRWKMRRIIQKLNIYSSHWRRAATPIFTIFLSHVGHQAEI